MKTEWVASIYPPAQPGHYLVCHYGDDHRRYRFVKYWNGDEWYHAYEEKYGKIMYWMVLPEFPH